MKAHILENRVCPSLPPYYPGLLIHHHLHQQLLMQSSRAKFYCSRAFRISESAKYQILLCFCCLFLLFFFCCFLWQLNELRAKFTRDRWGNVAEYSSNWTFCSLFQILRTPGYMCNRPRIWSQNSFESVELPLRVENLKGLPQTE